MMSFISFWECSMFKPIVKNPSVFGILRYVTVPTASLNLITYWLKLLLGCCFICMKEDVSFPLCQLLLKQSWNLSQSSYHELMELGSSKLTHYRAPFFNAVTNMWHWAVLE